MADSDVHVYPDDYFNDDPAAGYDDDLVHLESDYIHADQYFEFVGTYDLASEHDRAVYHDVIDRRPDVFDYAHEHHNDLVVVHRRCR